MLMGMAFEMRAHLAEKTNGLPHCGRLPKLLSHGEGHHWQLQLREDFRWTLWQ